jgi:L-lactate dehydrogenase complex protein LldG
MPARENILHKVRTAVGRSSGQPPAETPQVRLRFPVLETGERRRRLLEHFSGKAVAAASSEEARNYVAGLVAGRRAVACPNPWLERLGVLALPEVETLAGGVERIRAACAAAEIGITTAEYALCDTGGLVVLAGSAESRLASLLPALHVTILAADRILTGLDELFTVLPDPAAASSSMVLIGGPSKTADIEQILTLGVHGPRELHLVVV